MERKLTTDIGRLGAGPLSHEISSRYLQFSPKQMQSFCGQVPLKITAVPATAKTKNNVLDVLPLLLSYHSFFFSLFFFGIWGSLVSRNQGPAHSIRTRVFRCQQDLYKFKGSMQKQTGKCVLRVRLITFTGRRPPEACWVFARPVLPTDERAWPTLRRQLGKCTLALLCIQDKQHPFRFAFKIGTLHQ